jgi:putative Mg2+ transporter-C (MgtC) family protein
VDTISAPAHVLDIAGRLALAAVLGAVIGFDRELLQKPAGMRTHALVALGTGLIALVSTLLTLPEAGADFASPSRIIQGLVAGVGFIGGGVILRLESEQRVEGLTTAASVWVVAAIGIATGLGLWRSALITVVIAGSMLLLGRTMPRKEA